MSKKLLFIAPDFFNYHKLIIAEFEKQGWQVTYLNDRPIVNSFLKIGIRKFRFLFETFLDRYFLKELNSLPVFDRVVVIKGEGLTPKTINFIKQNKLKGPLILYYWDGHRNAPGSEKLYPLADKVFTFDPVDAARFQLSLLPLFFIKKAELKAEEKLYDWSFVGSDHSDRIKIIKKLLRSLSSRRAFVFVYFPSRLIYWFRCVFDSAFFSFKTDQLGLVPIDRDVAQKVFEQSVAVLDVHHPGQNGLTMRTLEVLSLGKKLITTNDKVRQFNFYNSNNICVIDRKKPVVPDEFWSSPFDYEASTKLKGYELSNWAKVLLESGE